LIVGAGDTAKLVAKELIANPRLGFEPIGFVDDDLTKQSQMLLELPVMGTLSAIKSIVEQHGVSELIIAMPSARGEVIRKVVRAGLDCGIPTLTVPSLPELISAKTNGTSLREVEIQDLLRREPVVTDLAAVAELATSETVLITGAGGSIGSELCRQVARLAPTRLILVGHGENSICDILHELRADFPEVSLVPIIADVRDRKRIAAIFKAHKPHAVDRLARRDEVRAAVEEEQRALAHPARQHHARGLRQCATRPERQDGRGRGGAAGLSPAIQARRLSKLIGHSVSSLRSKAIAACRSSRLAPVTRTASPW
jgi:FlaA1/EpsC-like NDP-sugar epimerase